MIFEKPPSLSRYLTTMLASGRVVFTASEAASVMGVSHGAFLDAAERLQRKHLLLSPRRGFYVIVPPQYAAWKAPPPDWYIDALMRYEGESYYVGLLQAAQLHGAAHQAVMEFQVVSSKRIASFRAGRNRIVFYYRNDISRVRSGIMPWKTDTGSMQVSSPALTAFDLVRYPQASAGLDHVVTVLSEMANCIDPSQLCALSQALEKPVVQRLGFLLESLGHDQLSESMHRALQKSSGLRWIELDPRQVTDSDFVRESLERNKRWRVIVRRYPERD